MSHAGQEFRERNLKRGRMHAIADLVHKHNWTWGVELGVYQGATTGFLLRECPGLYLIAVDWWLRTGGDGPDQDKETGQASYANKDMEGAEAMVRSLEIQFAPRLSVIKTSTAKAAQYVADKQLDFVFIDASHVTLDVVADIKAWERKIRAGGAVMGHDANWPAIQKALQICGMSDAEMHPGNVWVKFK